jgi:fatty acid desaturase
VPALAITDPGHVARAPGPLARAVLPYLEDERDLPLIRLVVQMTAVLLPCAIYLFTVPGFSWWLGVAYWALLYGCFFDRYILMLHATSHRRLFRREVDVLNKYVPWVLGPLCGETPETYFSHHVAMHHVEENLERDLSSTMAYQRDSPRDFVRYLAEFFGLTMWRLGRYHLEHRHPKLTRNLLAGALSFYARTAVGLAINWRAAVVVLIVPFLSCRFLMMCGNWGQHAFVDPTDPGNPYRMATTFINVRYNRRCFNDGYHVGHHLAPTRHWTELPGDFLASRAHYAEHDAIVLAGLDNFMCWALLMRKDYDRLARHFVDLRDTPRSHAEVVALLRSRTHAIR